VHPSSSWQKKATKLIIPTTGGIYSAIQFLTKQTFESTTTRSMEIIHVSAECYPMAKAGGLGDVVGALPKYQTNMGHDAKVVMPHVPYKIFV
jgi:hypothetical protein